MLILALEQPRLRIFLHLMLISASIVETEQNFSSLQVLVKNIAEMFDGCEFISVGQVGELHSNSSFDLDFNLETMNKLSCGVHKVIINSNITFPPHKDIHRFAKKHCSLGILTFHDFTEEIEAWLLETLLSRYGPVLRKDMDHFLIISLSEQISDKILLCPNFGNRIKYKLALIPQANSHILCKTVDLYGNGGLPKLKVVTFDSQNDQREITAFFPDFTKTFHGKAFRFAIPKVAFRFEIELGQDGRYHPKRGFYKWWLDEAMLKFNFTYDITWASFGGGTGKLLKNGTWVGATGDIFYDKADCSFIVGEIYSRHKLLGWSSSISYEWVVFVTHMPRKSYSPKPIVWSFTPQMWGLFLVSLAVMNFALKVIAQIGFKFEESSGIWGYMSVFEYIFSTLMEQDGASRSLRSSSIRVLCACWLLFTIVTVTAYKGKLVALIAFPVNEWVPTTFEELANSHFKVALNVVGKAGAAYVLIASSTSPVFHKLADRMELIPDSETCLERAMTEDLGCIIWKGIADYAAVKNLTDKNGRVPLQESSQIALFIGDGLVYERRAIFGEHFDRTIQAVVQMGLTIKWFQLDQEFIIRQRKANEMTSNIKKPIYDYDDGGPKKLILSQFSGLLLVCLCGLFVSGGQFIGELIWHRRALANSDGGETDETSRVGGTASLSFLPTPDKRHGGNQLALLEERELTLTMEPSNWTYTSYS